MTGFAWNTFQGAETDKDYRDLINCFEDVVEQLQKVKVKDHQISKYNDEEGKRYDYPTSIPNGQQIKMGDIFIFNLSVKICNVGYF